MTDIDREFRKGFITDDERYTDGRRLARTTDDVTEKMLDWPGQARLGLDDHPLGRAGT